MSTAGQKFMTELSTRSINAAVPSSSETCPLCGGNDLIRGVRYAKYSDTKDDAVRCQACDCNFPLKAWNARHAVQATPDRVSAAAEYLVQTVDRKLWGGIRADGRAKDGGFEPFHYSQHSVSVNGNARQEDYRDVVREIARILSLPSTQELCPDWRTCDCRTGCKHSSTERP